MCSTPDISVIIPMYNVKAFIGECLECLLRQGNVKLEVIIVDDGSSDGSAEIAKQFSDAHDNFRYFRIENGGTANARNYGVKLAKGKYLTFLDSDDLVADETYEKMYLMCERDGSEMGIMPTCRFSVKGQWRTGLQNMAFNHSEPITNIRDNLNLIYDVLVTNKLILRSFYLDNGFEFYRGMLYEDTPVCFAMYMKAEKVSVLDRIGYLWRYREEGEESITQSKQYLNNISDRFKYFNMVRDLADKNHVGKEFINKLLIKYLEHDMRIFVNYVPMMEKNDRDKMLDLIKEYVQDWDPELFGQLRALTAQKYRLLFDGEYEKIRDLVDFGNRYYRRLTVKGSGKERKIQLPEEYFDEETYDFKPDLHFSSMNSMVHNMSIEDDSVVISGYIYKPRLEVPAGSQKLNAFLNDSVSGKRIPVKSETSLYDFLNKTRGLLYSPYSDSLDAYDYTGATFRLDLNLKDLSDMGIPEADYALLIDYENDLKKGSVCFGSISHAKKKKFDGLKVFAGKHSFEFLFASLDQLIIKVREQKSLVKGWIVEDDSIVLIPENNGRIGLISDTDRESLVDIEQAAEGLIVDRNLAMKLKPGEHYTFISSIIDEDGIICKEELRSPLNKTVHLDFDKERITVSSTETGLIKVLRDSFFATVSNVSSDEGKILIQIKTHELEGCKAELAVYDELSGCNRVLASTRIGKNGNINFEIDFSDSNVTRYLYAGLRDIFIAVDNGNKLYLYMDIKPSSDIRIRVKDFGAIIVTDQFNRAQFVFSQHWSKKQKTPVKRTKMIYDNIQELRKSKIKKDRVVIQSGSHFNGVAYKVYEELKKRHPDFDPIIILDDTRLPLGDVRARKNSLAHFRYLSNSEYIITDTELSPLFRSKKEQTYIILGRPVFTRADLVIPGDLITMADECEKALHLDGKTWKVRTRMRKLFRKIKNTN